MRRPFPDLLSQLLFGALLGTILVDFGTHLGPSWPPRGSQNRPEWCPGALRKRPWKQVSSRLRFADSLRMLPVSVLAPHLGDLGRHFGAQLGAKGSQNQAFWHQEASKIGKMRSKSIKNPKKWCPGALRTIEKSSKMGSTSVKNLKKWCPGTLRK